MQGNGSSISVQELFPEWLYMTHLLPSETICASSAQLLRHFRHLKSC